ncbi:MAG: FAD-dependent oxidoreductase [Candidatus Sungbacteria bacterium]|nr:FAD-dependent oxidoreductase [Candidatus Sungbacteria bacterium]
MKAERKNIIIAGGGFGGITAALHLNRAFKRSLDLRNTYSIVLVNNSHSHLYTPALYEIAAIPRGGHGLQYVKSSITIPLTDIFHNTHVKWKENAIVNIDRQTRTLTLENGKALNYEYLILALGSETNYFETPGAKEYSFPLKTFNDAVRLRDRIQMAIESEKSPIRIAIAGAGASGVEVAAELENFICSLRVQYHVGKVCRMQIMLLEGSPEILGGFDAWVVKKARERLANIGVTIKTGALITAVSKDKITLKDNTSLSYDILIWAGGVKAASVLTTMGLTLSPKNSVPVNEFLEVEPRIYAIGDNAMFVNSDTGKPLPWNVPIAEAEARVAAKNVLADINQSKKETFRPWKKYPFILAVGRKYAIADLIYIRASGVIAWGLKLLVELRYLVFILPLASALAIWRKYVTVARSNDEKVEIIGAHTDQEVE